MTNKDSNKNSINSIKGNSNKNIETIEVRYKPVLPGIYQKYIIYTNLNNEQFIVRAETKNAPNLGQLEQTNFRKAYVLTGGGKIEIKTGKYDKSSKDWYGEFDDNGNLISVNKDDSEYIKVGKPGESLAETWKKIESIADKINKEGITSNPAGYNYFTDCLLAEAGLPLPTHDGLSDKFSPGSIVNVSSNELPISRETHMIYFGRTEIDTLLGGDINPGYHALNGVTQAMGTSLYSPIILDLDGDGVETLNKEAGVYFDHDGNLFAENTGWVAPDDGLLVYDRNGNGNIDDGSELFGNFTKLKNGKLAKNGYEALADLDDNHDGVIDKKDSIFNKLRVWQDKNSDGKVDKGELLTLDQAGVSSINTDFKNSKYTDPQGNEHKQQGTITYTNGNKGISADAWFKVNSSQTIEKSQTKIPASMLKLPYLSGSGNVTNLYSAMAKNAQLKNLVERFVADPLNHLNDNTIESIIFSWVDVNNLDKNSRGKYIDARELATIEAFAGAKYIHKDNGETNPSNPNIAKVMESTFENIKKNITGNLLLQTAFKNDFSLVGYDKKNDEIDFSAFKDHLYNLSQSDPLRYLMLRQTVSNVFAFTNSAKDIVNKYGLPTNLVLGSKASETLTGTDGDDILWGKGGNDTLSGGKGNDVYFIRKSDGATNTVINNRGDVVFGHHAGIVLSNKKMDTDTILFEKGITSSNLSAEKVNDDLRLFYGPNNSILIKDWYLMDKNDEAKRMAARIDYLAFSDGTKIRFNDWLKEQTVPVLGNTTANNTLNGGDSNDKYEFSAGSGNDVVYEYDGKDIFDFKNIKSTDVKFYKKGTDILVQYTNKDSVLIKNVFANANITNAEINKNALIESFQFKDKTLSWADINKQKLITIQGSKGSDRLYGSELNEVLIGGTGNDYLSGGKGDDLYLYNLGDGNDTIDNKGEYGRTGFISFGKVDKDTLQFGQGISAKNTKVQRKGNDLLLKINNNDSVTIQGWFNGENSVQQVDYVKFADGVVWTKTNLNNYINNKTALPVKTTAAALARSTNLLIDAMATTDIQPAMFSYDNNSQVDNNIAMLSVNSTDYVSR